MTNLTHAYQIADNNFANPNGTPNIPRRRWQIFLSIFLLSSFISQSYIFLQSATYESTATVLTTAPTNIDQTTSVADLQHVSIQQQILLSSEIMLKTAERLNVMKTESNDFTAENLRNLFSLSPEPGTNLLHLHARGTNPKKLQIAVNAWIDSYLQIRAAFISENTEKLSRDIQQQLQVIEQQVLGKRHEIEQFRDQHNIVSTDSPNNEVHARLQGLNNALNSAQQEEIKTKAKLDTLAGAISRNEIVVPDAESQSLTVLQQQAEKLREQLAAIQAQYTKEYIELNPNLRKTREQLAEIETKITEKLENGKIYVLQEAENNYEAAREAVIRIKTQLEAHKKLAAQYTSDFSEFQALQQELLKLETFQQETKQRLVDITVKQRENYPQVSVVDWASLPEKPISPDYLKESVLWLAICLAMALLCVMIMDYLNHEPPMPVPIILEENHLGHATLLDMSEQQNRVLFDPIKTLSIDELPKEMSYQEVQMIYQAAEPVIKGVITLIFNGLSLAEILSLNGADLNFETMTIVIPGQRNLTMTESVAEWFTSENTVTIWPCESEIKTLLCCAAIDSGLPQPEQISLETLRYTYMLFLLRQGIRLAELTKIFGYLSPSQLGVGASFPKANLHIDEIKLDYFKSLETKNT